MTALPVLYTGSYLTTTPTAGAYNGVSVLASLANPPAGAVTAQARAQATAAALGRSKPPTSILNLKTQNLDNLRNFYDAASILRDSNGNPIS